MNISRVGVELRPGVESMGYELTSPLVAVTIADLGAHLASVVLRLADDQELEVTVRYPPDAPERMSWHGATVGRYANRIANSRFTLDGVDYELEANEGAHQLHGGPEGFSAFAWSAEAEADGDTGRVVLKHTSKDGDMGFPGKVQATAVFELTDNRLRIDYRAKAHEPTPVNLTNHAYWNLGGAGGHEGHEVLIAASRVIEVDDDKIPVAGPPLDVAGTRFDCRQPRQLVEIANAGGYDHSFDLDPDAEPHVSLRHESGRRLDITTNQVGMQVYTGIHLDPTRTGVAFEPQAHPDTPNRPDFGDATVRPGDNYLHSTELVFHV